MTRRFAALAVLAALATAACEPGQLGTAAPAHMPAADAVSEAAAQAQASVPGAAQTASEVLATLTVKGRAPKTGYARDQFGPAWSDVDHNGCDTRDDVLARDLTGETFKPGTHDCVVLAGILADPYTGQTLEFRKGDGTSVDIDHVVALKEAWESGARKWSATNRSRYANDLAFWPSLVAVTDNVNQSKGDRDPAAWLPPRAGAQCTYAIHWVQVKYRWRLSVDSAERSSLSSVLSGSCGSRKVALPSRGI